MPSRVAPRPFGAAQASPASPRPSLVWDLPTRLFHWMLVAAVLFTLVTGLFAPKPWDGPHMIAGYVVAGLLLFRAVWAFFGAPYSRVASFAFPPRQVIGHFASLLRRPITPATTRAARR